MTTGSRSRRLLIGGVGVLVMLGGARLWAGQQAEPQTQSDPDVVTVQVEQRLLQTSFQLPAAYTFDHPVKVVAPAVTGGNSETRQIITSVSSAAGEQVLTGKPIVEINHRPLMLIQSSLPLYRDLRPGTSGEDVTTLQDGLRNMGYAISSKETGVFGPRTQQAVTKLFRAAGYEPDYTGGTAAATAVTIKAAADAAEEARRALEAAAQQGADTAELTRAYESGLAHAKEVASSEGVMVMASSIVTVPVPQLIVGSVAVIAGQMVAAGDHLVTLTRGEGLLTATISPTQMMAITKDPQVVVVGQSGACKLGSPTTARTPTSDDGEPPASTDATSPADGVAGVDNGVGVNGASPGEGSPNGASSQGEPSSKANGGAGTGDLKVAVTCDPAPALDRVGTDTLVTVTFDVAGPDSLVVPATALVYGTDGTASVIVTRSKRQDRVPVTVVAEADGFVAIESKSSLLRKGSTVVVSG